MVKSNDNINDPTEPEIVLFGLIFVNFLPLKIFPNNNPPISEKIHTKNKYKILTLKFSSIIPKYISKEKIIR